MRILYKSILFSLLSVLAFSCYEKDEKIDWNDNGIALPEVNEVSQSFFNLLDLENAYVEFDIGVNGSASSLELQMNFNGGDFATITTLSTFPSTVRVDLDDLATALGIDPDDLVPGDSFGAIFKTTVGTTVFESGTALAFPGACPSEIPVGSYTASQDDADGWFGGATTKSVTITDEGGGTYLISDVSAGGYELCCLGFGYNANQPALVRDVCNDISVIGTGGSQISSGPGTVMGSYDPATKTMTVVYEDTFNGSGDLTSVFVKD